MRRILKLFLTVLSRLKEYSDLALENLALRQQLVVLKRSSKRPRLNIGDRLFWVLLCRLCSGWQEALIVVKPDTVVRWHKKGSCSGGTNLVVKVQGGLQSVQTSAILSREWPGLILSGVHRGFTVSYSSWELRSQSGPFPT